MNNSSRSRLLLTEKKHFVNIKIKINIDRKPILSISRSRLVLTEKQHFVNIIVIDRKTTPINTSISTVKFKHWPKIMLSTFTCIISPGGALLYIYVHVEIPTILLYYYKKA